MTDVLIIGGGPGGVDLALHAAKKGLNVTLIEKDALGGTCLNRGCIPTKTYYESAAFYEKAKHASELGVNIEQTSVDFSKIVERKDHVVKTLRDGIAFSLKRAGVTVIHGEAKLLNHHKVSVNDQEIEATHIVLAMGSKNKELPIGGFDLMIDSTQLLALSTLPKQLVIVGGGVIGLEFASIFSVFHVPVTVIEAQKEILPMLDEEMVKRLKISLKKKGIIFINEGFVEKVFSDGNDKVVSVKKATETILVKGDVILKAVGRSANVPVQELEKLAIAMERGFIKVNEHFETSKPGIYAIGDCNGRSLLAHSATYQGVALLNHFLEKQEIVNFQYTPSVVYSFPLMATIGMSEQEAQQKGLVYQVNKSYYKANGKALAMNEDEGLIKMMVDEHDQIIGCHILGAEADVLIHEVAAYMNAHLDVHECQNVIHAHPTLSEVISTVLAMF